MLAAALIEVRRTFDRQVIGLGGTTGPDDLAGVSIPRTTYQQILAGSSISTDQLAPGDLVFPDAGHVQIYAGGGRIIEAPRTGVPVRDGALGKVMAARRVGTAGTNATNASLASVSGQLVELPGGNWNPLNWPGSILGNTAASTSQALWAQIQPFLLTGLFVSAGLGLVVIGTGITAWPSVRRGASAVTELTG